ncbi:hypothetical protein RRG08_014313 [Elysia crispata]|uniref:C-type lectin domain-containing protein n=1 Tax=Elysia crispata TaxID=231223 RepID=A0AAE0Z208_9GAST|nr:hypothetical protein RRG08_014313 [Elysia crispata]
MESILVLLLFIGFSGIQGQGNFDPCYFWPNSVYAGDGMCFKFVDQPNNFNDSQRFCKTEGARLAEARTQQQKDTIRAKVLSFGYEEETLLHKEMWLGGWDSTGGSNFVWLSDEQKVSLPVASSFSNHDFGGPVCLTMTSASQLATQSCVEILEYACQIYAGNPCDVYLPGGEYYDNTCFLPAAKPMTLQDATIYCEKRNAKIVEPSTETFIGYITQFANWNFRPSGDIWLGLVERSQKFLWQSTGENVTTGNWISDDLGTSVMPVDSAVVMNGTSNWAWQVVSRSAVAGVICQRDLTGECSGVFASGRCFNFYHNQNISDWNAAKTACQDRGSYLAEPKTEILSRTVEKYIKDTPIVKHVLLGATDLEKENTFVWDYSRELFSDTYTAWGQNQPNNVKYKQHYLAYSKTVSGWNDVSLNIGHSFICERVIPVYIHSYVMVLPKRHWATRIQGRNIAMLSVASIPSQQGHNYLQFSTFPAGDLQTITLFGNEAYQFSIDIDGLTLSSGDFQKKFIRVKSTDHLDVFFYLWAKFDRHACSSLILDELSLGGPSTFFSHPADQKDSSLAIVSTEEEEASSFDIVFPVDVKTTTFTLNNMKTKSRDFLQVSTNLAEQYQSLYVDSISGASSAQILHSNGAMNVYRFGRQYKKTNTDVSCEQILPVSMIGSDYITFPSLPMNVDVIDHYTVVAVYSDTTITVFDSHPDVLSRKINLRWPSDVVDLELPASSFYHVTGTNPFYLYARLTRLAGLCSVAMMQESLFRSSYQLVVVGALETMADIFVVVIVQTRDQESIIAESGSGASISPDLCKGVPDTEWSGCYFHLKDPERNDTFLIHMTSPEPSKFGAYLFALSGEGNNTICSHLGMPKIVPKLPAFDFNEFLSAVKSKQLCDEDTTTPATTTSDLNTAIAGEAESTTAEHLHRQVTTQSSALTPTTRAINSTVDITISEHNSVSPTNAAADIRTTQSVNPRPSGPRQSDTSAASNGILDITPSKPPPCREGRIPLTNKSFTIEEMEEAVEKIVTHLSVNRAALSSVKRSKVSAPDDRVSSTTIGMAGMIPGCSSESVDRGIEERAQALYDRWAQESRDDLQGVNLLELDQLVHVSKIDIDVSRH